MRGIYSEQPPDYDCPFCRLLRDDSDPLNSQEDIVLQNDLVSAFVSPKWRPNNHGHVLIIPNAHYENIFDLPSNYATAIFDASREIALAMRETYPCLGITTRQHNGSSGSQDVWHYHLHVFPRYRDDQFYQSNEQSIWVTEEDRKPYVDKIKRFLSSTLP